MRSFLYFLIVNLLCVTWGVSSYAATDDYTSVSKFIGEAEYNALSPDEQALIQHRVGLLESDSPLAALCFAGDVPPSLQQAVDMVLKKGMATRFNGFDGIRWTSTATDGGGINVGDPITITWSIVPDGTDLGLASLPTETDNGLSDLIATFNAYFGSQSVWEGLMQSVFDQWSRVTGITYVKVSDDGAVFPTSSGALGSRGDVRIGGRSVDGAFGVLAYNFFPTTGDMLIDTDDTSFFGSTSNAHRAFRNTFSHEHGHGLGFDHVCPVDNTKIMEPFITLSIDHSGPDDIAHGNRKYGDAYENSGRNDSAGTASDLGAQGVGTSNYGVWPDPNVQALSLNGAGDVDYYSLDLTNGQSVSFHMYPRGSVFAFGDDPGDLCSTATIGTLNSLGEINIDFELIGTDGSTVLLSGTDLAAGFSDDIFSFTAPSAGTYYLRVYTNDAVSGTNQEDQVQLYRLRVVSPGLSVPVGTPAASWSLSVLSLMLVMLGGGICWSVMRRTGESSL